MKKTLNAIRSARVHIHGSVERIGFRRSDKRHPRHPEHFKLYHTDENPEKPCSCVGVGHPREALKEQAT